MLSYVKARKLAETWVELTTDGACEIYSVEDKPYGWIFYYKAKDNTPIAGNAPLIVDRVDYEIRVTGVAHPIEKYIEEYESSLPEARLMMAPERHDGNKKYAKTSLHSRK